MLVLVTQTDAQRGRNGGNEGNRGNGGNRRNRRSPTPSPSPSPSPKVCEPVNRQAELSTIESYIRGNMTARNALMPMFVRAAFHDCVTATADKPLSGCNGSLRLAEELSNANNGRLRAAITTIEDTVGPFCMSVADGIQFAGAIAVRAAGGPDVINEIIDVNNPRVDVDEADTVDNELPDRDSNFAELVAFYARKSMSMADLVSSSAGGHSLGGVQQDDNTVSRFTRDSRAISNSYALNLVQRTFTGQNVNGFFTLNSDWTLTSDPSSLALLRMYAGCKTAAEDDCQPDAAVGLANLNNDFASYLLKISKLTGASLV